MIKIWLKSMGIKHKRCYRIVVADSRTSPKGKYIEQVGIYHPLADELKVNNEIALKWLRIGAQPTETVKSLLSKVGVIKQFTEEKLLKKQNQQVK